MTRSHKIMLIGVVAVLIIAACSGILIARGDTGAKGLAMANGHPEDLGALGVSWWYTWGENCKADSAPGCVNMVRSMQLPAACYDYLLVGNEPNAIEPYGAPVTPYQAALKARAIEKQCPKTRLVVGNVSVDDWRPAGGWGSGSSWLRSFLYQYLLLTRKAYVGAVGVHCYTQHLSSYCVEQLGTVRALFYGEMWVTEWGVTSGDSVQFESVMDYISDNFNRYAVYTNRQPPDPCAWCGPRSLDLVNTDGSLTANGIIYRDK